jgi:hypothetical protein
VFGVANNNNNANQPISADNALLRVSRFNTLRSDQQVVFGVANNNHNDHVRFHG